MSVLCFQYSKLTREGFFRLAHFPNLGRAGSNIFCTGQSVFSIGNCSVSKAQTSVMLPMWSFQRGAKKMWSILLRNLLFEHWGITRESGMHSSGVVFNFPPLRNISEGGSGQTCGYLEHYFRVLCSCRHMPGAMQNLEMIQFLPRVPSVGARWYENQGFKENGILSQVANKGISMQLSWVRKKIS